MRNDERRRYSLQDYATAEAEIAFRTDSEILDICRKIGNYDDMTPVEKGAHIERQRRQLQFLDENQRLYNEGSNPESSGSWSEAAE